MHDVLTEVHPEPAKCVGHRALGLTGRSLLNILEDTAALIRDYKSRSASLASALQTSAASTAAPLPSGAAAVLAGPAARRPEVAVPTPPDASVDPAAATTTMAAAASAAPATALEAPVSDDSALVAGSWEFVDGLRTRSYRECGVVTSRTSVRVLVSCAQSP